MVVLTVLHCNTSILLLCYNTVGLRYYHSTAVLQYYKTTSLQYNSTSDACPTQCTAAECAQHGKSAAVLVSRGPERRVEQPYEAVLALAKTAF